MEILGIGPGEFILILIVLLVVVGPERLPGLARQVGQFLVRARNWLQTSPDAALVLRARQEIEAELASIKNSLMEVQVVRDEVLGAAKQFEDSVGSIAPPKFDMNSLVNPPAEQTITANGQAIPGSESTELVLPDGTSTATTPLDQRSTLELPNDDSAPINPPAEAQPANSANGVTYGSVDSKPAVAATSTPVTPALGELESINIRLQAIMADMWALQQQLKQRGALDETWQPPSLDVQLPTPEIAAAPSVGIPPTEPASIAEPIEDEVVLAARKHLEQLAPMRVADYAPPVIEAAPSDSAPETAVTSAADAISETAALPALVDPTFPTDQPATKTRKRRAAATAEPIISEAAETPMNGVPEVKTRKRRAASTAEPSQAAAETPANSTAEIKTRKRRNTATSTERADATEPVTTEKAS